MVRLLASTVIAVIANAIALVVTDQILGDMSLAAVGFITALVIFTVVAVLIEPLLRQIALKNAPAILGSSSLIATLVALGVTSLFGDALHLRGPLTWILASVLVWAIALAGRLLLPLVIFKKALGRVTEQG